MNSVPGRAFQFKILAEYLQDGLMTTPFSPEVTGRTAAPQPTGFNLFRTGAPLASLGPSARAFADRSVPRVVSPPRITSLTYERPEGVLLTWSVPDPSSNPGAYRVEMPMDDGSVAYSQEAIGARAPLVLEGYRVIRDGIAIETVSSSTQVFDDTSATFGPGYVYSVSATEGTRTDGVELSWSSFEPRGTYHEYAIESVYASGDSARSASGTGARGLATVIDFEIERDGAGWESVGTELSHVDAGAPGGTVTVDSTVEVDPILSFVQLGFSATSSAPPSATYRVRALYDYAQPTVSDPVTGRRGGAGVAAFQWQRSVADADGGYVDIPGATGSYFQVLDAPVDQGRYYRLLTTVDSRAYGSTSPRRVVVPGFKDVVAGAGYSCGVQTGGALVCFGSDLSGLLQPPAGSYKEVGLSYANGCGVKSDGSIICWGDNQIGLAPTAPFPGPFASVSMGTNVSCGIDANDGGLLCWGEAGLTSAPAGAFTQVSSRGPNVCALDSTGAATCWGSSPWQMTGLYQQIALGLDFACGLDLAGEIECEGALTTTDVPAGSYVFIDAGDRHACGVRLDGTAACWGDSRGGTPPPNSTFARVSAGVLHSCGVRTDGKLDCWGLDFYGEAPHQPAP
ncbi:RCC1 domain-containing protein [Vulgatibacter incomptus]|uniref:RCC1 domain-containing protein n=1 Tax=Vulgatibacter incomptus TaxID=1391653 RepID=UPI0012FCBAAE|nr:hypothetical protein [Vulgatibacter incomptus]